MPKVIKKVMLTYNSSFNAHDIIYHLESRLNFHQKTEIINISIIIISSPLSLSVFQSCPKN